MVRLKNGLWNEGVECSVCVRIEGSYFEKSLQTPASTTVLFHHLIRGTCIRSNVTSTHQVEALTHSSIEDICRKDLRVVMQ